MKKRVPVSKIMAKNVVKLNTTDDLATAEKLFKKHRIRHIPVVSGDKAIGMLSYTDLMRISFADAIDESEQEVDSMVYNMFTIEQVMAKNVISVSSDTTIQDTAKFLAEREFHALPVIDDDKLVGIVTTTDLIRYLIDQY